MIINESKNNFARSLIYVSRALSKDRNRQVLNYLKIEDGKAIATDGRRLHMAEVSRQYEDGLYQLVKRTQKAIILHKIPDDMQYPDYKAILPSFEGLVWKDTSLDQSRNFTKIILNANKVAAEKRGFNFTYVSEAIDEGAKYSFEFDEKGFVSRLLVSVSCEPGGRLAIILPMLLY